MNEQTSEDRIASSIARALSDRIHRGDLKSGEPLPAERALMTEFGASRGAVREALQLMSNQGLLKTKPRHRPIVCTPGFDAAADALGGIVSHLLTNPDGIKNLFDTRVFVETGLVRHAAKHASKQDISDLHAALIANKEAIADNKSFFETDTEFHAILYRSSQNPALMSLHKAYVLWLAPQWTQMPRNPTRNTQNYEAHRAIYEAILLRDPDLAEAALAKHLKSAWEQVRTTFGDN